MLTSPHTHFLRHAIGCKMLKMCNLCNTLYSNVINPSVNGSVYSDNNKKKSRVQCGCRKTETFFFRLDPESVWIEQISKFKIFSWFVPFVIWQTCCFRGFFFIHTLDWNVFRCPASVTIYMSITNNALATKQIRALQTKE